MVQILLSTYNGGKYLSPLMDSLIKQDYPNLGIFIRDDGSTDDTKIILRKHSARQNVEVIYGENIGVVKSFFELLKLSSPEARYIAFCDQDDVWETDKISRAVELLSYRVTHGPGMYCGRLRLVNRELSNIGLSKIPQRGPSFKNALVENIATGCTIVMNSKARNLVVGNIPPSALMHDWWIYLVVSSFGTVIYDKSCKILYRQHSDNVIGIEIRPLYTWLKRFNRFKKIPRLLLTRQANEFREIYGPRINSTDKNVLDHFLNERQTLNNRVQYALSTSVYRQSVIDNIILKSLIVINRV